MNFILLQDSTWKLIKAHQTFSALAAETVHKDLGNKKPKIEAALEAHGYAIGVWPPTKGHSDDQAAGQTGVLATIVVRLEVSPTKIKSLGDEYELDNQKTEPDAWVNGFIADIVAAVLEADPEPGGVRFELAPDAFEMVDFDEGLLSYHIRFNRFTVFGS